jgi:hypothetical protein
MRASASTLRARPTDRVRLRTMTDSLQLNKLSNVVLGISVNAEQAEVVRQRARDADRSVSSELRRQLFSSGYLPRPTAQHTTAAAGQ